MKLLLTLFTIENDCVDVIVQLFFEPAFICILNYNWCSIVSLTGLLSEKLSDIVNQFISGHNIKKMSMQNYYKIILEGIWATGYDVMVQCFCFQKEINYTQY